MDLAQPRVRDLPAPTHVLLLLTYRCNLRCPYCLVFDPVRYWAPDPSLPMPPPQSEREMTLDELLGRVVPELEFAGVSVVALTGGEVMLRRDFAALVEGLGQSRLDWCLDTNLSRCSPANAEALIAARATTVYVSVDGLGNTHNLLRDSARAFGEAMSGLDHVLEARRAQGKARTAVVANCVLQPGNEHVPPQIVNWASRKGLDGVSFQLLSSRRAVPGFRPDVALKALEDARSIGAERDVVVATFPLRDPTAGSLALWFEQPPAGAFFSGCDYIYTSMRIDPSGNVIPCVEHCMGNILDKGLLEIWRGPTYTAFRERVAARPLSACARCCNLTIEGQQ